MVAVGALFKLDANTVADCEAIGFDSPPGNSAFNESGWQVAVS